MHERGWVDGYVFSILALAFSKWGEIDKAMQFIDKMRDDQNLALNDKTFYALIHGFVKESIEDMALKLLKKMLKLGFTPDVSLYDVLIGGFCFLPYIVAYSATMDGLVKINEVDHPFELFQDICTHGCRPDVVSHNVLIKGFCKAGKVNEANNFLNKMRVTGLVPSVVSYNLL
ncbi:putative pentatricopeptide repeat-containing protein At5g08310, mitochondrial [Cucumis melo]|uniref:Pentatricopeptide repeat-containing protein At5g08310, mitochondrial n=1 Tax=Cucumis melo TaxID=3656 RepID=A0ABM3L1V3_CUCME|nr:putative pentatricopeptide repeat-containing protein At5g08310, mitochondrial [Cucumis melo]